MKIDKILNTAAVNSVDADVNAEKEECKERWMYSLPVIDCIQFDIKSMFKVVWTMCSGRPAPSGKYFCIQTI